MSCFQKSSGLLLATTLLTCHVFGAGNTSSQTNDNTLCGRAPHPMRVTARHIDPQGIGYRQGYTTLEGFFGVPQCFNDHWVPFFDLRGHVFNDGRFAANAGVGVRYIAPTRVWGTNVYYDYRNTHRQHYNQVGFGFENLGRVWDFRLNGYFPVGDTKSSYYHTKFHEFEGHYAILERKYQFAMKGFDAEVGTHVNMWTKPWYFTEGVYYLENNGRATWGGKARISVDLLDYLRIEGNTSYDHIFKWIGQGQVSVIAPFGNRRGVKAKPQRSCSREVVLVERAFQPVARHEIIPVDSKHVHKRAVDPTTGKPYVFYFVDNTSHSQGTFESPFNTLIAAETVSAPNDVIYVFPGDGTTNNMNQGVYLKDDQRLWGAGVMQFLPTTVGMIAIPAQAAGTPRITNTGGNGVVLAPNSFNEVSGIVVMGAAGDGIYGLNMTALNLLNTSVFGSTSMGVSLTQTSGSSFLNFVGLNASNNTSDGLNIQAQNAADVTLVISQGAFIANGVTTSANGVTLGAQGTSVISGNFQNSRFQNNGNDGIQLTASSTASQPFILNVGNSILANNQLDGLRGDFSTGTATAKITLSSNVFSGNSGAGSRDSNAGCWLSFNGNDSFINASNNQLSNNHQTGLILVSNGTNNFTYTLDSNQFNGNEGYGIDFIGNSGTANIVTTISGNQIDRNDWYAFYTNGTFGAATFNFLSNDLTGNCDNGFFFTATHQGAVNQTFSQNTIVGNCSAGIQFNNSSAFNQLLTQVIENNEIVGNCGQGIQYNGTFTTVNTQIENNEINGNCGDGIEYNGTFGVINTEIVNNIIGQNGGRGIRVNGTVGNLDFFSNNNQVFGNENEGIVISSNSSNVTIENSNINNNNSRGISLILSGTQPKEVVLTGNSIANNNGDGMNVALNFATDANNNTYINSNNTVFSNHGNGIALTVSESGGSTGTLTSTVNNNTVNYNTATGIGLVMNDADGTFALPTTLMGNKINNNRLLGLVLAVGSNSVVNAVMENNDLSFNLHTPSFQVINGTSTVSQCVVLEHNISDTGYLFDNGVAGSMTIVPTNASSLNVGTITTSGTVIFDNSCP